MTDLNTFVKEKAYSLGFEACRITPTREKWTAGAGLEEFISKDYHGSMTWIKTTLERRIHPNRLWIDANSAIVVGINYSPVSDPIKDLEAYTQGNISVYARGDDYHDVIKRKLKNLAQEFAIKSQSEVKVFVDTAPLMEKPLAERAGVGWQGKHTNLVSRTFGSWLFLGVILTNAKLTPDEKESDHCGSCRACLDICPTDAFVAPYKIDARKCISYLTIEHKGMIPHQFRKPMGNRIYGCDDCLAICPWNKFAKEARESKLKAREDNELPSLIDLVILNDTQFRERFRKSPVKRIGRNRFIRNVLIALGNSGQTELAEVRIVPLLDDEDPIIRCSAVWALSQLDPDLFQQERKKRQESEKVKDVQDEWSQAYNH